MNGEVTLHVSVWVEMKRQMLIITFASVTLHVSVWVEIFLLYLYYIGKTSRSTWACELKFPYTPLKSTPVRHAPRERVSWNGKSARNPLKPCGHAPRERVSWNFCTVSKICATHVTLHVSVWVEMFRLWWMPYPHRSRSTWACELKFRHTGLQPRRYSHAPRERVSWNVYKFDYTVDPSVTLHVSVWVEISCRRCNLCWS